VHGDVHPGNILFTKDAVPKMYLLDAGIARSYSKHDHQVISRFLTHIIRSEGRAGADVLIADSRDATGFNPAEDKKEDFRGFFEGIVAIAHEQNFFDQIGNYVVGICDAASKNKVMLNSGFISIALSIRVMEGVALALNEDAVIWKIANKIILKAVAKDELDAAMTNFFAIFEETVGKKLGVDEEVNELGAKVKEIAGVRVSKYKD